MVESALAVKATEKLTSILVVKIFQQVSLLAHFREEFGSVCKELISIKALLKDSGNNGDSTLVSSWLDRLELVLLDAVDVVDECGAGRKFWNPFFRLKMVWRIKELKKRISEIHWSSKYLIDLSSALHVNECMQIVNASNSQYRRGAIAESQTVGMDHDINSITELICQQDVSVIAIKGIGGRGKTRLLHHVFDRQMAEKKFDHMVFLSVSQKFSFRHLLHKMFNQLADAKEIEEMENELIKSLKIQKATRDVNYEEEVENKLKVKIKCKLEGRRSLLALDDVWDPNLVQNIINLPPANGANKVLITTRGEGVVQGCAIHDITPLSDDDSFKLFCIHAFPECQENRSPVDLDKMVRGVVERCCRLPLALQTIGSRMKSIKSVPEWERTLKDLQDAEASIMSCFRLSYEALPNHLKPCFLYCSVFSENTLIKSECLIHAWIAEGFISTSTKEAAEGAYAVGCSYLNKLIDLGLIEVSEIGGDEQVKHCKMHDLLHEFALLESRKQNNCLLEAGENLKEFPMQQCLGMRRISLIKTDIPNIKGAMHFPVLRTLLLSSNYSLTSISSRFFKNMRYLTVLDLSKTLIRALPKSMGDLKYVKYLNLSGTTLISLPKSLSGLKYLQFLDVSYCSKLRRLHSRIGEHKSMLYLNAEGCPLLKSLPVGISKLVSLQTLKGARVSMRKKGANALQLTDLKRLTHLQHLLLIIDYCHKATGSEEAVKLDNGIFQGMTKMRILEFSFINCSRQLDLSEDMAVMESLEIVRLSRCVLPNWISKLHNLKELKSESGQSLDYGGLHGIPKLRILHLSKYDNCVRFPKEFGTPGAFPELQQLIIEEFKNLKIFPPLQVNAMAKLKYLRIKGCPKLVKKPERFERLVSIEEEQDLEQYDLPSQVDFHLEKVRGYRDCHMHSSYMHSSWWRRFRITRSGRNRDCGNHTRIGRLR